MNTYNIYLKGGRVLTTATDVDMFELYNEVMKEPNQNRTLVLMATNNSVKEGLDNITTFGEISFIEKLPKTGEPV